MDKTLQIIALVIAFLGVFVAFFQNEKLNKINNKLLKQSMIKDTFSYMEPTSITITQYHNSESKEFLSKYSNCLQTTNASIYNYIFFKIDFYNITKFKGSYVFIHDIDIECDPLYYNKPIKIYNLEKFNFKHRIAFDNNKQTCIIPFTVAWAIDDEATNIKMLQLFKLEKFIISFNISYLNNFNIVTSSHIMLIIKDYKPVLENNEISTRYVFDIENFSILDTKFNYTND